MSRVLRLGSIFAAITAISCGGGGDETTFSSGGTSTGSGGAGATATSASGSTTTGSGAGTGGGSATCSGKTGPAGDAEHTLSWAGADRAYRVHTPPGYDGAQTTPVVLVFHGWLETNDDIEALAKMTPVTDQHGAIVVYAQGLSNSWNAGSCCGTSAQNGVDDVGFVGAMITAIEEAYCVDDRRIFSAGFSNGGMLSHRLACELSDRIAAIGPVAGTIAVGSCSPIRPVPVMHFHGTSDPIVGYATSFGQADSVPDTIAGWVQRNGCGATTTSTFSQGDAHCESYEGCSQGATVTLCTLEGGGHQWPGGQSTGIGALNTDIFASEAILGFFEQHPMP